MLSYPCGIDTASLKRVLVRVSMWPRLADSMQATSVAWAAPQNAWRHGTEKKSATKVLCSKCDMWHTPAMYNM